MSLRPFRCVVIEDDVPARRVIQELIEKTSFLKLQAAFDNPVEALLYLRQNDVDLLFLDIEMLSMTGFDLIGSLDTRPYVVGMTSSERYAVEDHPRFMKVVSGVLESGRKSTSAPDIFL